MSRYCGYFQCDCEDVTEELMEEYGEQCLVDCEDCEYMEN